MEGARFTCCNLRYDDDWVSDANWATLPMIPAGSRIKVIDYGQDRANVLIEGRKMRIGLEYGTKQIALKAFVEQLLIDTDPIDALHVLPEQTQRSIGKGQVMVGMTRPQVLMAIGYPRADTTSGLESDKWVYWTLDEEMYTVEWDSVGVVARIDASDKVRAVVEYRP
jgi:hypothetical protein